MIVGAHLGANIMAQMVPSSTPHRQHPFRLLEFTIDESASHLDAPLNSIDLPARGSIHYLPRAGVFEHSAPGFAPAGWLGATAPPEAPGRASPTVSSFRDPARRGDGHLTHSSATQLRQMDPIEG